MLMVPYRTTRKQYKLNLDTNVIMTEHDEITLQLLSFANT
jgi:hypothetical protein